MSIYLSIDQTSFPGWHVSVGPIFANSHSLPIKGINYWWLHWPWFCHHDPMAVARGAVWSSLQGSASSGSMLACKTGPALPNHVQWIDRRGRSHLYIHSDWLVLINVGTNVAPRFKENAKILVSATRSRRVNLEIWRARNLPGLLFYHCSTSSTRRRRWWCCSTKSVNKPTRPGATTLTAMVVDLISKNNHKKYSFCCNLSCVARWLTFTAQRPASTTVLRTVASFDWNLGLTVFSQSASRPSAATESLSNLDEYFICSVYPGQWSQWLACLTNHRGRRSSPRLLFTS